MTVTVTKPACGVGGRQGLDPDLRPPQENYVSVSDFCLHYLPSFHLSPDVILCGRLGSKHQLTNKSFHQKCHGNCAFIHCLPIFGTLCYPQAWKLSLKKKEEKKRKRSETITGVGWVGSVISLSLKIWLKMKGGWGGNQTWGKVVLSQKEVKEGHLLSSDTTGVRIQRLSTCRHIFKSVTTHFHCKAFFFPSH